MFTGRVRHFNDKLGFGFIRAENGLDYFFHFSSLLIDGYKTTAAGDQVTFEVGEGKKGPVAQGIMIVKPAVSAEQVGN